MKLLNILISTPVGRTEAGNFIDYFPSRWSGSSGAYKTGTFYPYNLAYLSAYLKKETQHNIKMIDPNYYGIDFDEYIDIINQHTPDIFIVEIDAIVENRMLKIIASLRKLHPSLIIIACGPSPTANPEMFINAGTSFVVIGEFEGAILSLISSDFNSSTLGIYPNKRARLINLDSLPFPEDSDIKRRNYCRHYGSEYNEVEIYSTRGCPHMCNFCVIANVYAAKPSFRIRNTQSIIEEIKYLQNTIPHLEGIFFNEDSHTSNKKFIIKLCNEIIKADIKPLKINCMTNYDTLDRELLVLMKKAGYYKIRIGIESLDSSVSQYITTTKIKSNHDRLFEVLDIANELGIKVYVTLSVGAINSTYEKDITSLQQVEQLYENNLLQEFSVSMNTPMPGTPFYDLAMEKNWFTEKNSFDGAYLSTISYPNYTAEEIEATFAVAQQLREKINNKNKQKNISYSMYDKQWCAPVYAVTHRKIGDTI